MQLSRSMHLGFQSGVVLSSKTYRRRKPRQPIRPCATAKHDDIPKPTKSARSSIRAAPQEPAAHQHAPGFVYRPEAVLGLFAVAFLSSIAYLATVGRHITAKINKKAAKIAQERAAARQYVVRMRQKQYLESAVQATNAMLMNTEDYLTKQAKRAQGAEQRLQQLSVSSAELETNVQRAHELKVDLGEKETALAKRSQGTKKITDALQIVDTDVSERRTKLSLLEGDLAEARQQLGTTQEIVMTSLRSASMGKQSLQSALAKKQSELVQQSAARDTHLKEIMHQESSLKQSEAVIDRNLAEIEQRREIIDSTVDKARQAGRVASQAKLALNASIVRRQRADDLQNSRVRISQKQELLKSHIEVSDKLRDQKASECGTLKRKIADCEKLLSTQLQKLSALESKHITGNGSDVGRGNKHVVGKSVDNKSAISNEALVDKASNAHHSKYGGITSNQCESRVLSPPSVSTASAEIEAANAPNTTANGNDAPQTRKRRGRPRKTNSDMASSPTQTTPSPPKKTRGRPRKKNPSALPADGSKRKRGRPRKNPPDAATTS